MVVPSGHSEKRLLWHPRRDNKFVVGDASSITLYEWAPDYAEIRHVAAQHDLQGMKCFAWSPDPAFGDLLAVGFATGRVNLTRLEVTKHARHSVLSSKPIVSLSVRNPRPCNALAFNPEDPNCLAVGLDRVKGDHSLMIWDIHSAVPALSLIPDQGPRAEARLTLQHAATESVSALAFLPQSPDLLLASISHRWLKVFDARSSAHAVSSLAIKVHGLALDPLDHNRFACFSDRTVTVFDARRMAGSLIAFTDRDAAADGAGLHGAGAYSTLEFSSTRRGMLATLGRDAAYVRFWDLQQTCSAVGTSGMRSDRSRESSISRVPRLSWANLSWAAPPTGPQAAQGDPSFPPSSSLVLSDTRKTKEFNRPLASFALVPSAQRHPLTSHIMTVNRDGDVELCAVHDAPRQVCWSGRGELCVGAGQYIRTFPGFDPQSEPTKDPWEILNIPSWVANDRLLPDGGLTEFRKRGVTPPTILRTEAATSPALHPLAPKPLISRLAKDLTRSPSSSRTFRVFTSAADQVHLVEADASVGRSAHDNLKVVSKRRSQDRSLSRSRKTMLGHVIEQDVLMVMRKRILQGYGLSEPYKNQILTRDDDANNTSLPELWWWVNHVKDLFSIPSPKVHGFDFTYQGLHGVWEGFTLSDDPKGMVAHRVYSTSASTSPMHPQLPRSGSAIRVRTSSSLGSGTRQDDLHGDFQAAVSAVVARQGTEATTWKSSATTSKLAQRQLALQLCGWTLRDDDLTSTLKRWEKEGKHSKAACWMVFTRQFPKAVELLMRSKDESHHMMSGTLAALTVQGAANVNINPQLREHCERLIVRLQDPYFRALLTYLTSNDWSEVLEEEALPFRERLAIAFQFLDDKSLSSYLRRNKESCCQRGDIEGLIVTGLTPMGMDILQSYVDRTGDVQTAAILSSYVSPARFEDSRAARWLDAYRDFLDGLKLFHHRVQFDIERGRMLQAASNIGSRGEDMAHDAWVTKQILIRCSYCNKTIGTPSKQDQKPTTCTTCGRSLPRCSVCLLTLGIMQDEERDQELSRTQHRDTMDDAIVICQTCRHGGHAAHIMDWFGGEGGSRSRGVCAVADCECRCGEEM